MGSATVIDIIAEALMQSWKQYQTFFTSIMGPILEYVST